MKFYIIIVYISAFTSYKFLFAICSRGLNIVKKRIRRHNFAICREIHEIWS